MKFLQHLIVAKSSSLAKFQLKWLLHVSASSCFCSWTSLCGCKATILNLDPNLLKLSSIIVLPKIIIPDNTSDPNHFCVDHQYTHKFDTANFPWIHTPLLGSVSWYLTSGMPWGSRTSHQKGFSILSSPPRDMSRGDHMDFSPCTRSACSKRALAPRRLPLCSFTRSLIL